MGAAAWAAAKGAARTDTDGHGHTSSARAAAHGDAPASAKTTPGDAAAPANSVSGIALSAVPEAASPFAASPPPASPFAASPPPASPPPVSLSSVPPSVEPRTLRLSAPPDGLLAAPLLRLVEQDALSTHGLSLRFVPWRTQEQARALILSGGVDLMGFHVTGAATLRRRGVPVRFLGASLGNVLYVVSSDESIRRFEDLRGRRVVVPFRGEFPDTFFGAVRKARGFDRGPNAVTIRYAATSLDAANLVGSGRVEAALIAEPHASTLIEKTRRADAGRETRSQSQAGMPAPRSAPPSASQAGMPAPRSAPPSAIASPAARSLHLSINMQDAWEDAFGAMPPIPSAGIAAFGGVAADGRVLALFWEAYTEAVRWCLENPRAAVALVDPRMEADAATGVVRAMNACARQPLPSRTERADIERFLRALDQADPDLFQGWLPDDNFYWAPGE